MRLAAAFVLWAGAAAAQDVTLVPYGDVAATSAGRFDFETFPTLLEPGQVVDGLFGGAQLTIGEAFAGLTLSVVNLAQQRFDDVSLADHATNPLEIRSGAPGHNHAVSYHAGFGSNALFPLGPDTFPAASARGEGAVALRFATPVQTFGFKVHADYADPMGTRHSPGLLRVLFFDERGSQLGLMLIQLSHGVEELGFRGGPIAGVLITNTDPGGVAIDDIIFPVPGLTG